MKNDVFAELLESANEALEHVQGKKNLKTTALPIPPKPMNGVQVKRARASLHASQAVFAAYLNVSTKLVQAWEANRRRPEGPALVLLNILVRQPRVIEKILLQDRAQPLPKAEGRHDKRQAAQGMR